MIFGYARYQNAGPRKSLDAQQAALTAAGAYLHGHVHRHQDGPTGMGQAAGELVARRY